MLNGRWYHTVIPRRPRRGPRRATEKRLRQNSLQFPAPAKKFPARRVKIPCSDASGISAQVIGFVRLFRAVFDEKGRNRDDSLQNSLRQGI